MKIVKYFIIAFTFWMRSLIPRRLQGEKQIISGTTDKLTAQFTPIRDQSFQKDQVPGALEGPLICLCANEAEELGHFFCTKGNSQFG